MTDLTAEQIDLVAKLLEVLQKSGVRTFRMGELAFELGPMYRANTFSAAPMESESPDDRARRQKQELENLLYASAGS